LGFRSLCGSLFSCGFFFRVVGIFYRVVVGALLEEPIMYILVGICLDLGQGLYPVQLFQKALGLLGIEAVPDKEFHVGVGQVLGLVCSLLLGSLGFYELEARQITAKLEHFTIFLSAKCAGLTEEACRQGNGAVLKANFVVLHGGFLAFVSIVFRGCLSQPCDFIILNVVSFI